MINLRQQMRVDAVALLNPDELGEVATWSDGSSTSRVQVRCVEQSERQTIKRASIFALHGDQAQVTADSVASRVGKEFRSLAGVAAGDTFTVVRGRVTTVYRVLYSDNPETALQRHNCHQQLPSTVTFVNRDRYKSLRGSDEFLQEHTTSYRAKFVVSDADNVSRGGKRRMRVTYQVFLETLPTLTTDQILIDSDGRGFRIEQVERPLERIDLPYLLVSRSDG